jgi:4-amino-4-deoxy-L-arabinose transferase-like glycosyltransferase
VRYWFALPIALTVALLALRSCLVTPQLGQLTRVASDPRDPPGTVAYTGSLMIARGGPVIIGFQSKGKARLVIGDKDLVGRVLVTDRIVLPQGPIAIRFAVPAFGRLVWCPVGRRGDPEYVPASSLSPEPPERASFVAPGTSLVDGVTAVLLVLVFVGSLVMLARHRLRAVRRETWLAMGAVFLAACVVRWLGLFAFGQTWDEDVNWAAGRNYITNVLAFDISPGSWGWNFEHPPMMKYLAGIGAQLTDGFGAARALSAIWVAIGCALLVPIGARLYNLRTGILAAAIAALLPPLVAHGQIVGHEAPTVLWWSLGILLALTAFDGAPAQRALRIRLVWLGVVIGVAISSRFVNGLLGVLVLLIVVERAEPGRRLRTALEGALIMPPVALATFYALWPRIWFSPVALMKASYAKLKAPHAVEPFFGVLTNEPGPHYFLVYLVATLPLAILLGVLVYSVRAALERNRSALIVAAWFVVPLAVVASPVRQDGVRYVMPCILALALASAAGWEWLVARIASRVRHAFAIATTALCIYLAITLARIHPYYLDYFGEHVGGPSAVSTHGVFETAWWGEGVDRAVDYVNAHAAPNARVFRCILPVHVAWFREDLWKPMVDSPEQADWIVVYAPRVVNCPCRTTRARSSRSTRRARHSPTCGSARAA